MRINAFNQSENGKWEREGVDVVNCAFENYQMTLNQK